MRIGVTGHQSLRGTLGWEWIDARIREVLAEWCPDCVGITSLAGGADQHFAKIVLELGGSIEVIVPFPSYETRFGNEEDCFVYDSLLRSARVVLTLPREVDDDQLCYLAAGQRVVDRSDLLLAVWDGKPAGGSGGTADVVAYAYLRVRKVIHVDPVRGSVEERTSPRHSLLE